MEDILQWIRGKNIFIEEDCMIVNFGFVYKRNCFHACLTSLLLDGGRGGFLFTFNIELNGFLYHTHTKRVVIQGDY